MFNIKFLFYLFPLLAGICICFQGLINGYWQSRIGIHSTILINGIVVTTMSFIFYLFGNSTPINHVISSVKPWLFFNGLFGFIILTIAALAFPRIGATSVIVIIMCGQILTGVIIDHLGLLNLPHQPVSFLRIVGILLLFIGTYLAVKY